MKKLLILMLITVFTVSAFAYGHGTVAGNAITNQAYVTASNLATPVTNYSDAVTVRTQAGGVWSLDTGTQNQSAAVGSSATWVTTMTNYCNFATEFRIKSYLLTNGNSATVWTNNIQTTVDTATVDADTATGNSNDTASIAAAGDAAVTISVDLAGDAVNDDFMEFAFFAFPLQNTATSYKDQYDGDNGITYGGTIGTVTNSDHAGVGGIGMVPLVNYDSCRVTCSGPVLTLNHDIVNITNATAGLDAGQGATDGLPGSTVTFRVHITNSGSSTATNLEVVIPVNASFALEAGSDRESDGYLAVYGGNDNGEIAIVGTDVIWEPNGTAEAGGANDGYIEDVGTGTSSYCAFYKATID